VIIASPCLATSTEKAEALWNWVLSKQGLASSAEDRLTSVRAAAEASLGLHAARVASPFVTAAARTTERTPLCELLGDEDNAALVTIRCVRKTLHTLPLQLAAYAHAATRHYRLSHVAKLVRQEGIAPVQLEDAADRIIAYLRDYGRQSHRMIEHALATRRNEAVRTRIALKWLWERGDLTYRNCASSWHQEQRRFSLRSVSHPHFDISLERGAATTRLTEAYFRTYGPATVRDMAWWSGLGRSGILEALSELDAVSLSLPWAASPFYMLRADYEVFLSAPRRAYRSGVHFLAHEDVALKAYFESRTRYLAHRPASMVFNRIGEALPAIVHNGRVIGQWSWHHELRQVQYRTFSSQMSKAGRSELPIRAKTLQGRLRSGYMHGSRLMDLRI
jgi:hypothetical protein